MRDAAGDAPEPFKPLHPTESGLLDLVAPAASLDKDNQDAVDIAGLNQIPVVAASMISALRRVDIQLT